MHRQENLLRNELGGEYPRAAAQSIEKKAASVVKMGMDF
jgi:hypothetical protein